MCIRDRYNLHTIGKSKKYNIKESVATDKKYASKEGLLYFKEKG